MRVLAFSFLLTLLGLPAIAQDDVRLLSERAPEERPQLLVVGSVHFGNPGRDDINYQIEDVLTDTRQEEIERVVRQLAALQPTHVAIEWSADAQDALDERYRGYLAGTYVLNRSEANQIGFRVAKAAGLERVDAVDWNGASPGDEAAYDWYEYGKSHGQAGLVDALIDPARAPPFPTLEGRTVAGMLLEANAPAELAALHRVYFDIASVGDGDVQAGANWVGHWYARNLRIFNRLVSLADSPEDRVVVIYGAGHAFLLNRFAEQSGAFELLHVDDVISDGD